MRAACVLALLITSCEAYSVPMLTRRTVAQLAAIRFITPGRGPRLEASDPYAAWKPWSGKQEALILSCGEAGRAIAQRLKRDGYQITVATTKPKREQELRGVADRVVVIPQIETAKDEELAGCVLRSDLVVLADTIKIFSPHTFVRTRARVRKIVEGALWPGKIALVSSESAYGCPRKGEILKEDNGLIYAGMANRTQWRMNTNVLALQIRHAEALLLKSSPRCFVLRTAGIWDESKFYDVARHTAGREFNYGVGESMVSFATTNLIAEVTARGANKGLSGIYNVANLAPARRKDLLRCLHVMYGMRESVWSDGKELDLDEMFSVDPEPLLPSSQRGNSRMSCGKLRAALGLGKD